MLVCKECSLHKQSRVGMNFTNFTKGRGDDGADAMVVFEMPAHSDIVSNKYLSDVNIENFYRDYLGKAGITKVYFTALVKCTRPNNKQFTKPSRTKCMSLHLSKEIADVKPKIIITVGKVPALEFITGFQSLEQSIGSVFSYGDIPVVPIFNLTTLIGKSDFSPEHKLAQKCLLTLQSAYTSGFADKDTIEIINDYDRLEELGDIVGLDIETEGLDYKIHKILTVAVSDGKLTFSFDSGTTGIDLKKIHAALCKRKLILHNAVFDLKFLRHNGCELADNLYFDTMSMQYLIDSKGTLSLGYLCQLYFNINIKEDVDRENMSAMDSVKRAAYCGSDAYYTLKLCKVLMVKIKELDMVRSLHVRTLCSKLAIDLEYNGICFDAYLAKKILAEFEAKKFECIEKFKKAFKLPDDFNVQSPKQLTKLFYEDLKIPVGNHKTEAGNPQVDEAALEYIAKKKRGARFLVEYRTYKGEAEKAVGYIAATQDDGRIHSSFNITSKSSLRLMSQAPNCQNAKRDSELKKCFKAKPGYSFVYFDFSALEFRLWVAISKDPTGIQFIKDNKDIHCYIGSLVHGRQITKKDPERDTVKRIVYGSQYGNTPEGIAYIENIPIEIAAKVQRTFFNVCKLGRLWIQNTQRQARTLGYVATPFGARRVFPGIKTYNAYKLKHAMNEASNYPIQSWGNELVVLSGAKVLKAIKDNNIDGKVVHQIHDAFIFEVKDEQLDIAKPLIKAAATSPFDIGVPLDVDLKVAKDWYALSVKEH